MVKLLKLTETELYALESLIQNYLEETDNNTNKKYYTKLLKKIQNTI